MSKWSDLKVSHKSEEAPSRKLAVSDEVAVFLQGQAEFRYNTVLVQSGVQDTYRGALARDERQAG